MPPPAMESAVMAPADVIMGWPCHVATLSSPVFRSGCSSSQIFFFWICTHSQPDLFSKIAFSLFCPILSYDSVNLLCTVCLLSATCNGAFTFKSTAVCAQRVSQSWEGHSR